jgi:hypothetical protein
MATHSLAAMTVPELRREYQLAKVQLVNIVAKLSGTRGAERVEIEESAQEAREYLRIIEARIARLERKNRTQT